MPRYLMSLTMLVFLAAPGWSQDENSGDEPVAEAEETVGTDEQAETTDPGEAATEEDVDDADLDLQTYEEDDDDFVPTEEIPADQPIPFPSNI